MKSDIRACTLEYMSAELCPLWMALTTLFRSKPELIVGFIISLTIIVDDLFDRFFLADFSNQNYMPVAQQTRAVQ